MGLMEHERLRQPKAPAFWLGRRPPGPDLVFPSLHEKYLSKGCGSPATGIPLAQASAKEKFSEFWLRRAAWLPTRAQGRLLFATCLILFCLPYWHGAVTLALLLLLLGMAFPARAKLAYLCAALVTLGATLLYSRFFAGGVGIWSAGSSIGAS